MPVDTIGLVQKFRLLVSNPYGREVSVSRDLNSNSMYWNFWPHCFVQIHYDWWNCTLALASIGHCSVGQILDT